MPAIARHATLLQASLIADSLAMPAHWIYEPQTIVQTFGRVADLVKSPSEGHYHAKQAAGGQTHYGDQALLLMAALGNAHAFDAHAFMTHWQGLWGGYDGYKDGATRATLANLKTGADPLEAGAPSHDLGGASRIAPLLVALADAPEDVAIAAAIAQTDLTHRDPAVQEAAVFLVRAARAVLAGTPVSEALEMAAAVPYEILPVADMLNRAKNALPLGVAEAVASLGDACAVNGAFPATLAIALAHPDDLETALIENVMAGGDSAARGLALGILLGGAANVTIPARWLAQWQAKPRVDAFLAAQGVAVAT